MAAIVTAARPLSQILPGDFDLFPSFSSSPSSASSSSNLKQRPQGHYRPFSTLYTDSPYVELEQDKSTRLLKRASSLGGLHTFRTMNLGLTFKPKKNTTPPASPTSQLGIASQKVSNPLSLKQRLKTNQDVTKTPSSSVRPASSVKKKRSVMSLFSAASASENGPGSSSPTEPSVPSPLGARPVLVPPENAEDSPRPSTGKSVKFKVTNEDSMADDTPFVRKSMWSTRFNMKLHPYQSDVPYMQAYTPILLESDRHSDLLLQRLGGGYPSFGEYRAKEPLRALDLGCGEGNWIMYASTIWVHTHFTGFDLVDITAPAFEAMENTHFVQGNFIQFPLPFADCSFDYVRLANLVLCVPYTKWDRLLKEVRRILTVGGRIEVIDDQMFFPYAQPPKPKETSKASRRSNRMSSAFDLDDFSDGDLDGDTLQGYESGEDSMFNSEGTCVSSFEDKPDELAQLSASETVRPYSRWHSTQDPYKKPVITDPYLAQSDHAIWQQRAMASRELESTFEAMLTKHGVYLYPSEFILEFMQDVFGTHAGKTQSFHIKLAEWNSPIGANADTSIVAEENADKMEKEKEKESMKKPWMTKDWDRKKAKRKDGQSIFGDNASERSSLESPIPDSVKPKAAKQLGLPISVTTTTSSSPSKPMGINGKQDKSFSPSLSASPSPVSPISSASSSSTPTSSASSVVSSSPVKMTPPKAPNAKTAALLGVSYTELVAATAQAISNHRRQGFKPAGLVQSPGLLIGKSYMAVDEQELEMHACKYMHTLLGCRPALGCFVEQFKDEEGKPFVSEDMFAYYIWEYEAFRRIRLGWPSHIPEKDEAEDTSYPTANGSDDHPQDKSPSFSHFSRCDQASVFDYQPDETTHIRTIRVFEAIKVSESTGAFLRLTSGYGLPKEH